VLGASWRAVRAMAAASRNRWGERWNLAGDRSHCCEARRFLASVHAKSASRLGAIQLFNNVPAPYDIAGCQSLTRFGVF
jgi:hypothetical protein